MRIVAALGLLGAVAALIALVGRSEPPIPLLIDAAFVVPTPPEGTEPIAIPDPNALYAPCPMTPRNLLALRKRTA